MHAVDLNTLGHEAKTVGDVIDRINASTSGKVEARINDTGDGILLVDKAGGSGTLSVSEVGTGTDGGRSQVVGERRHEDRRRHGPASDRRHLALHGRLERFGRRRERA